MADAKEVEKTMGNIVQLLHDANKPAEGLATKMSNFAQGGKKLEVLMRFASGTGLWKILNYIKAAGISLEQWNKSAEEYRQQLSQMYTEMSKQKDIQTDLYKLQEGLIKIQIEGFTLRDQERIKELGFKDKLSKDNKIELQQLKEKETIMNSGIIKGLTQMYGKEYALKKLRDDTTIALKEQERKLKEIRKLGSDEDLLGSITSRRTKKGEQQKFRTGDAAYGRALELKRRGIGGIKTGYKGWHEFVEHGPIKKFFATRFAKLVNIGTIVGNFISGMSKMIKAYLMGAVSLIGSILMWGAVIILAIILLKPVFLAMWESIKKHGPALLEKLKLYWEEIKIIMEPILAQVLKIWDLFIDPKSSFGSLIGAVFVLLGKLLVGTISLLLKVGIPLALDILFNIAGVLINTAGILLDSLLTWLGTKTIEFIGQIPEYYDKFKLWLTKHPFLEMILTPVTNAIDILRGAWQWFENSYWYKKREESQVKTDRKGTAAQDIEIWKQKGLTDIKGTYFIQEHPVTGEIHAYKFGFTGKDGEHHTMPKRWNKDGTLTSEFTNLKSIGAMARGGFVGRSGQYLVGERGPEIVNLSAGSNVTPNHAIGNTVNVHVNGRVGASDQELRDIARRVGAMINREINRTTTTGVR
jgi:hypothetical protein